MTRASYSRSLSMWARLILLVEIHLPRLKEAYDEHAYAQQQSGDNAAEEQLTDREVREHGYEHHWYARRDDWPDNGGGSVERRGEIFRIVVFFIAGITEETMLQSAGPDPETPAAIILTNTQVYARQPLMRPMKNFAKLTRRSVIPEMFIRSPVSMKKRYRQQ